MLANFACVCSLATHTQVRPIHFHSLSFIFIHLANLRFYLNSRISYISFLDSIRI
ncbi:hypothetical protein HFN_0449 [Helicobacter fennelliae MRY12-0050]|uniref:Uncharacterized protein n=1 Tax=Helicobacter fennelliae MRY12-0050 TaxID=1325130 RepID=T1DW56_9HELI|nr:hypothetical protein HFN_0449 [Helicobacter fennelliae MRY12-0050]